MATPIALDDDDRGLIESARSDFWPQIWLAFKCVAVIMAVVFVVFYGAIVSGVTRPDPAQGGLTGMELGKALLLPLVDLVEYCFFLIVVRWLIRRGERMSRLIVKLADAQGGGPPAPGAASQAGAP